MTDEVRQEHAKRLLEDKLFQSSIEGLKTQLMHEWAATDQHDVDSREQIWLEIKLVDRLVAHLQAILEAGQITKLTSKLGKF